MEARYISLSLCLFVCLSLCYFVSLSLCLFVSLSLCLFVSLSLCLCLSVSLSLSLSVSLSLCLSDCEEDLGEGCGERVLPAGGGQTNMHSKFQEIGGSGQGIWGEGREGEGIGGRGVEGMREKGRGAKGLRHTYRQTYRHTDPPTKRVLEKHSLLKTLYIIYIQL